ncbi:MAG: 16S rRNA (guanine(527)-N(7))-methyltransferase RsmG [Candidatus Riflebacteria bacterium HGW-Riflebacteria-1]|jgi:16S rRNA (guanine527-N7)-methyltransferase|nr:MAG: 16S rRNA (guanine(527)-N(7))-methyltransferase RsmG [Candidatus Riflebacteria bacterium HGW-Riflebacteria-1]
MSDNNLIKIIEPYVEKLNIPISRQQLEKLQQLSDLMLQDPLYSSVSKISEPEEVAIKHFLDSLIALAVSPDTWKSKNILDLGTGGGFPCLPLAVVLPQSNFIAVDSRQKSVEFVARMAEKAGIKNVQTRHARIEDIGRDPAFRERSDLVVCRALSAVRILVEYTLPLLKNGGQAFYYKGPKVQEELFEAANAFSVFGVASADLELLPFLPPEVPYERNFVKIVKRRSVPAAYPRKAGMPASRPL